MANKLYNRAKMTTATTGTGTLTLGSAVTGFLSFADAGASDADVISYVIADGASWEVGYGTYTASGTTLSRTVRKSSNSNSAINLSGSATVAITPHAEDLVSGIERSARTSNTILAAADQGKFIDITSGTFTQTFTAAATLGSGWWCYLGNSGTGDITLDPNSTEQIDGLTSYIMYPGELRLIQCDGSALRSIMLRGGYRKFTSSGTFVVPPGIRVLRADVIGAGGGGGSGTRYNNGFDRSGGAGGGGGCRNVVNLSRSVLTAGASETITVGAGGTAGAAVTADTTAVGNSGGAGGTSSFGSFVSAYGGGGGSGGRQGTAAGSGGGGGSASAGGTGTTSAGTAGSPSTGSVSGISTGGATGGTTLTALGAEYGGAAGGGGIHSSATSVAGGGSIFGGPGGGGGGRISSADSPAAGAAGGNIGVYSSGGGGGGGTTAPTAGTAGTDGTGENCGTGGGGGGAHASAAGGAGGNGGAPAGGGGGGATSANGANSGAGGTGGRGEVRLSWW